MYACACNYCLNEIFQTGKEKILPAPIWEPFKKHDTWEDFFLNKTAKIFGAKFGSDQGSYIIKIIQILKLKKHFKNQSEF